MRGNEFIRGVMDFANAAAQDADSANFALGELIGGGFQSRQEPTPTAGAQARPALSGGLAPQQPPPEGNWRERLPSLVRSESGGNNMARNDARGHGGARGHFGALQFGHGRLTDAKRAGVIPQDMTPEQFMRDEGAQIATENWHFDDINSNIERNRLGRFEGGTIKGIPITREGMLHAAHLGGFGGLQRFLKSGGDYDPADANGTRLSDYMRMGSHGPEDLQAVAGNWARAVTGSDDPSIAGIYDALTTTMSTSGQTGQSSQGGAAGVSGPAGSGQIEELIGGMVRDIFGPEDGDTQRARAHKSSIWENLSVSLGQMAAGQPVNVSSVLRAQENSQQQIVVNRMEQHRMRAGAAAVLDSGGSPAMAQAVATGAVSFSDVLNERQISNAETQLARENMQDDTRREAFRAALRAMGYPEELINLDPQDIGSFVELNDMRRANEAGVLAQVKREDFIRGIQQFVQSAIESPDPTDQATARMLLENPIGTMTVPEAREAAQKAQERDLKNAELRQKVLRGDQEAARELQEQQATDRMMADLSQNMQSLDEFDREVLRQYQNSGGTITASEAEERAAEALDLDPVVVGNRLVSKRTGEVLVDGGDTSGTERERAFTAARRGAEDQGRLPEFDARYPNGMVDFLRELARIEGTGEAPTGIAQALEGYDIPQLGESNENSLLDRVSELGGVQQAGRGLVRATAGQLWSGATDPRLTAVETAYASWRNDAIQSLRAGGRLLAQELALIQSDVAPQPGLTMPPEVFVDKMLVIDGELRRKLSDLERTGEFLIREGLRDSTQFRENAEARSQVANVIRGLHDPKESLSQTFAGPVPFPTDRPEVSAVFSDRAARTGRSVEQLWNSLSENEQLEILDMTRPD